MPPTGTSELEAELDGVDGVLPNQYLERLVQARMVSAPDDHPIPEENVQPASLDLRLGPVAFPLQCSFLPGRYPVEERMADLVMGEVDLRGDGGTLEIGRPYLIPLQESLRLLPGMRAKANPKSSTGRADVFTRVITDRSHRFDEIRPGYAGRLYLEVVPLSFPVRVAEDLSLNQLRISVGRTSLQDEELREIHETTPLLYVDGAAVASRDLPLSNGLFLGVNLKGTKRYTRMGYRALERPPLLDMTKLREAPIERYWERIPTARPDRVILEPKRFYLLMSNEAVCIPPRHAAEMTAYDPTSGELRTHYAGFFDPGFGYDRHETFHGSTAALEVRAHDVGFMIEHGQLLCKLTFERMAEEPSQLYGETTRSNYQRQTETLGKHFKVPAGRPAEQPVARSGSEVEREQLPLFDLGNERS